MEETEFTPRYEVKAKRQGLSNTDGEDRGKY